MRKEDSIPRAIRVLFAATLLISVARAGDEDYKLGPDSMGHEGVPRGTVTKNVWRSKIFFQDGDKGLDNAWGNWWLANLEMEAALKFKHYDYKFVGGTGGHRCWPLR